MKAEPEIDERTLEYIKHMRHSKDESDRGFVIFTTSQIDYYLRRILEGFLIDDRDVKKLFDGPYAPLSSISGKTRAAHLLGLITRSEATRISAIRKVRNIFAHVIDASFEHDDIRRLCARPPIHDDRLCDRDAFLHMAMNTVLPLMYRDVKVRKEWKRSELPEEEAHDPQLAPKKGAIVIQAN